MALTASVQRNYPIRATVQYTPPYSLFLGDYATPKLIITLTGQDLLDANCPYKLIISRVLCDLEIFQRDIYYLADIKLTIQDWYGADFEDFFTSIKSKFDCLNAFFVLQHKFGCKPFKTTIIYHDYVLLKKNE